MTTIRQVKLQDVCAQYRKTIRPGECGYLRYIGLETIEANTGQFIDGELSKTPETPQANSFHFSKQHVLYGKLRPYLNKVALPNFEGKCSTEIIPLLPKNELDRAYLAYFLRSSHVVSQISAKTAGSRMPRADMDFVLSLQIPLPPLSEQRRLVDILSRAEGIVRLRREAQKKAAELIPALFLDRFGDPATNPKGWEMKPLGELIRVKSGSFLPLERMVVGGKFPVYGGNGINGWHSEFMFDESVVVIGRVGAHCGNVHLSQPCCWVTDNALYVAERFADLADDYLVWALQFAKLNQYAGRAAQPLISGNRIYPVKIMLPPSETQRTFGERLGRLKSIAYQQATATQKAQATFDALLARTFGGL